MFGLKLKEQYTNCHDALEQTIAEWYKHGGSRKRKRLGQTRKLDLGTLDNQLAAIISTNSAWSIERSVIMRITNDIYYWIIIMRKWSSHYSGADWTQIGRGMKTGQKILLKPGIESAPVTHCSALRRQTWSQTIRTLKRISFKSKYINYHPIESAIPIRHLSSHWECYTYKTIITPLRVLYL